MQMRACWFVVIVVVGVASPRLTQAFTLDGYFKMLELVAKSRDMWRKIFLGNDIGFVASPWLFKDRVKPPYVPMITTFPKYPANGHYRNECEQPIVPASSAPVVTGTHPSHHPLVEGPAVPPSYHPPEEGPVVTTSHLRNDRWAPFLLHLPEKGPLEHPFPNIRQR